MSGRKSTEVNGLLARGKNARNAGNASYLHTFHDAEKILKKNESKIAQICDHISGEVFRIDADCRSEFPKESEQLENSLQKIIKANKRVSCQQTLHEFQASKKQIDADLEQADRECDHIRERIKNKRWYCDDEYRQADRLLKKYQQIAGEKSRLAARVHKTAQESSQDLVRYENMEAQMSKIKEAYEKLQKRTDEIRELRSRAEEAKKYISKLFKEADAALAEKFLPDEYSMLSDKVRKFCALDDRQAVQQISVASEQISVFSNRLQQCYARFLEQKDQAETALSGNKHLLSTDKYFYFDPIDYFKRKEDAGKIPLLDYLSEYSDQGEMIRSIEAGIDLTEELIKAEAYDAACEQSEKNTQLIEKAAAYAAAKQEHLIENFYVARDIKKVMTDMGFEAGAIKQGGNIKNGWRITAKSPGGESIDFSQVLIDDDGKVKIDIDHNTAGNCSAEWADICSALDHAGIYIERIDMENGTNVINKREGVNASRIMPDSGLKEIVSNR